MKLPEQLSRFGWIPILLITLGLSNWSLAVVAHSYKVPMVLAYLVSVPFDVIALRAGSIALFYARTHGESGLGAKLFTLSLVAASAYFNIQHAIINHDPFPARMFFASFPVAAYILFELESRRERRVALKKAGRIAEPLTNLGRWRWMLFPIRSFKATRKIELYRLDKTVESAMDDTRSILSARESANSGDAKLIRAWALDQGMDISPYGRIPKDIRDEYYFATGGFVETESSTELASMNGSSPS